MSEVRNPKSEGRNPKEGRSPNSEIRKHLEPHNAIRTCAFVFVLSGNYVTANIRISDFGFQTLDFENPLT